MYSLDRLMCDCWLSPDHTLGLHTFQFFRSDFEFLPHSHPEYNLIIGLSGKMEFDCGAGVRTLEAGDVVIDNPGQMHRSRYGLGGKASRGLSIVIQKSTLAALVQDVFSHPIPEGQRVEFPRKVRDAKVLPLAGELVFELRERKPGYVLLLRSLICELVVHLIRNCCEPVLAEGQPTNARQLPWWEMLKATAYMNSHGKRSFKVGQLCSELGISPQHFIPLFRNATTLDPHVYYNKLLIGKAQALLQKGDASVKEVAYELDFHNVSHFCSLFHHVAGTTPAKYQRTHGQ